MPAVGTNIVTGNRRFIKQRILEKLGLRPKGHVVANATKQGASDDGTALPRMITLLCKNGAPATNTAADAPTGVGDLCWDELNDDLYRCTAYTSTTVFTWAKIVD